MKWFKSANVKKYAVIYPIILSLIVVFSTNGQVSADSKTSNEINKIGWIGLASGGTHKLGIKDDGTVWGWGINDSGQVGNVEVGEKTKTPVQVKGLSDVVLIAAGNSNSYAIKKDGSVWAWGENTYGQVADGNSSTRKVGSVSVTVKNHRSIPVHLKGLSKITSIVSNYTSTFAMDENGDLWGWGRFISDPYQATPLKLNGWSDILDIATGETENLYAVTKYGTVWKRGKGGVPEQVIGLEHITAMALAQGSIYALKDDGTVWSWGENNIGQLGDGTYIDKSEPQQNPYMQDVVSIQATSGGPVYLKRDGTVWTHGSNSGGQLGIGSYDISNVPVQVKGLTHIKKISAASTGNSVMALREDNTLWSWGDGYTGDGTEWYRTVPVMVKSYETQIVQDTDTIKVDINGKGLYFDHPPPTYK